jgi:hypothetical protein
VLVEVNDEFTIQQKSVSKLLKSSGFRMKSKLHAEHFDFADNFTSTSFNQIWVK